MANLCVYCHIHVLMSPCTRYTVVDDGDSNNNTCNHDSGCDDGGITYMYFLETNVIPR